MVSNVGSAAISAVSLVDSINILVIQAFYALAAGGTIVCSQYIGQKDKKNAEESARQLSFVVACISSTVMAVCLLTRGPLLRLIFGSVEADIMEAAQIYSSTRRFRSHLSPSMMPVPRSTGRREIQGFR